MYLKIFLLLFCVNLINRSCAEIKNERVKNLIEVLQNDLKEQKDKLPRPSPPSYLDIQEASSSSIITPALTRHHLVSGSQLNTVYKILLKNSPEVLIEIFRSIYFNLPAAWRNNHEDPDTKDYLEAIKCLDDDIADEDLVSVSECKEKVKMLHALFYWRPDNIQIGPSQRFRDGGAGYDYDCFYLLRGVEMIYNIEFRIAIEAIIDVDSAADKKDVNQLLRASHNMITNRNVARNYNPSEWIFVDSNYCYHSKPFRKSLNMLEKTFDLKRQELRTVNNAQHALTVQSMNRLVAWTESVLETYQGNKKNRLQKLADLIKKEKNKEAFTALMLDFMKISNDLLDFQEYIDFISLYSGDNVITPSMLPANLWYELYENYKSVTPTMSQEVMNEVLKKWNENKKLVAIFNTLRSNKGKSDATRGYISSIHNIIKYNTYFMYRYLGQNDLTLEELYSLANCIDTNNVTSTVKDFKELRKKDDDDDEERDKNKNLSNWYSLLTGVYRLYEHKLCAPHFGESVQNVIDSKKKTSCPTDDNDPTRNSLFDIMNKIQAIEKISPDIKECSANMNTRGNTRIRAQRDVGEKSVQEKQLQLRQLVEKQLQLRQLVEEVYQNINSTYPYDRATVLYQMVANRMHPLIKQSLNTVCHIPDSESVDANCQGYRYPGCYWDQPALEKATIVMDKMTCHGLNILSFGIGYFFNKC